MITWTCHICGDERPDNMISVVTKSLDFGHGIKADQNIRYCNDRPSCFKGTETFSFVKNMEESK